MKISDEEVLAEVISKRRRRLGLSQAELAEAAEVSTKTIQRLETCKPIAASSRRAVLTALEIDPDDPELARDRSRGLEARPWAAVENARVLLSELAAARSVDVERDREGWHQARRARPWYRQDLVIATRDPTELILKVVDRAKEICALGSGQATLETDALCEHLSAAEAVGWALATSVDGSGCLHLYIGSSQAVAERIDASRQPAASAR